MVSNQLQGIMRFTHLRKEGNFDARIVRLFEKLQNRDGLHLSIADSGTRYIFKIWPIFGRLMALNPDDEIEKKVLFSDWLNSVDT